MQKSSVNKVVLVGHIGNKPEGRYTKNGISSASFSLATNESWVSVDNEKKERTEWHNIIAWNKLADFANEYLYKGQLVYIEGKIQSRVYKDKENIQRKIIDIISSVITPLEWRNSIDEEKNILAEEEKLSSEKRATKRDNEDKDMPF